jgi:rhodanese-related sulfurtransferase
MKIRILGILSGVFFLMACNSNAQNVDVNVFEQKIKAGGVQVLDVRTAGEYNGGHLKNVLQADWTDKAQFAERTKYLDKNKTLLVYCAGGGRSGQAAVWLKEQGFKEVVTFQISSYVASLKIFSLFRILKWVEPPIVENLTKYIFLSPVL